jgi:hypothetical protein
LIVWGHAGRRGQDLVFPFEEGGGQVQDIDWRYAFAGDGCRRAHGFVDGTDSFKEKGCARTTAPEGFLGLQDEGGVVIE